MPRKPRIDVPGLLYHVIVRGIERSKIFLDEKDYKDFLLRLEKNVEGSHGKIFAWSLMPNHVHLLMKTGERPLNKIMRKLLTGYAVRFNLKHHRMGHLFQNRYKSIVCEEEQYLLELLRYIHLNPIRAKIIQTIDELNRYPWTGHAVIMGNKKSNFQAVEEILERFGKKENKCRKKYLEYIQDGIKQGTRDDLRGGGLIRSKGGRFAAILDRKAGLMEMADDRVLGSGIFVENTLKNIEKKEKIKKQINYRDSEKILGNIAEYYKLEPKWIKSKAKREDISKARAVFIYVCVEYTDKKMVELAEELELSVSGISRSYYRGESLIKNEDILINMLKEC